MRVGWLMDEVGWRQSVREGRIICKYHISMFLSFVFICFIEHFCGYIFARLEIQNIVIFNKKNIFADFFFGFFTETFCIEIFRTNVFWITRWFFLINITQQKEIFYKGNKIYWSL